MNRVAKLYFLFLLMCLEGTSECTACTPPSTFTKGGSGKCAEAIALAHTNYNACFGSERALSPFTMAANGCTRPVYRVVVTDYPMPDVSNNPLNRALCSGVATSNSLTNIVSGTNFTRNCSPSSANVTGYSTGKNFQELPAFDMSTIPLNQQQCFIMATNLTLMWIVSGTIFSRSCTPAAANLSGYGPGNGTQTTNVILLRNMSGTTFGRAVAPPPANLAEYGPGSGFIPAAKYYRIFLKNTPLSQQQCNNMATNIALTSIVSGTLLHTNTPVNLPLNQQNCNDLATNLTLTSNVSGTTFIRTVTPSTANLAGYGPGSGQSTDAAPCKKVSTFEWTVTPSLTNLAGYGPGSGMMPIHFIDNHVIKNTPLNQKSCNIKMATEITLTSNVSGETHNTPPFTYSCNGSPCETAGPVSMAAGLQNTPLNQDQCNEMATSFTPCSNMSGTSFTREQTPPPTRVTGPSPG